MSVPRETIGHGRTTVLPVGRGPIGLTVLPAVAKISSSREALAIAFYAEWWRKRYPSARRYPWEEMRVTCPNEREAWLAVADMAILNLCS